MSREVRKVPVGWVHPRYTAETAGEQDYLIGRYVGMHEGGYADAIAEWNEDNAQWEKGFVRSWKPDVDWEPKPDDEEHAGTYTDWHCGPPSPSEYMPDWTPEEATQFMMYETTSEGTPKSPAFATPEELARWLADTGASAFADETATYEQWLKIARGSCAPSFVVIDGVGMSGVAAASIDEVA